MFALVFPLMLIALAPLLQVILQDPWATIIYAVLVPLIVQVYRLARDKWGEEPSRLGVQVVVLLLAFGYVLLTGGFAGLQTPTFPAWVGDIGVFVLALLLWLGAWLQLIIAAAGSLIGVYEIVLKTIFEKKAILLTTSQMQKLMGLSPPEK